MSALVPLRYFDSGHAVLVRTRYDDDPRHSSMVQLGVHAIYCVRRRHNTSRMPSDTNFGGLYASRKFVVRARA